MTFSCQIPTPNGNASFALDAGTSIIFVGANGSGKTRLAVHFENAFRDAGHRISAHRALALDTDLPKIKEDVALAGLRTGYANSAAVFEHRQTQRWAQKQAVGLLNDFSFLIQALFAEQTTRAYKTHSASRVGDEHKAEPSNLERLVEIWDRLLPHRHLILSGDDIVAKVADIDAQYAASEMSDGERAIFYMLGQALTAKSATVLIVDEPELHVHRSIMSKLWDEIESARPDCAFIFITHDLEFAASRVAQKFVVRSFTPEPMWTIEGVPEETGFSEETTTLILGSRRPILFVEGASESLDLAIYRCCFPEWTVLHRGGCEAVIHSVVTFRKNESLTRVTCSGIVDGDDYVEEDAARLADLNISVLPVSEIENVLLLPDVARCILGIEGFGGVGLEQRLNKFYEALFATASLTENVDKIILRHCVRRIDRKLKQVGLSDAVDIADLQAKYDHKTSSLDIAAIAAERRASINAAATQKDAAAFLRFCDMKRLFMSLAATHLKGCRVNEFEAWVMRKLRDPDDPKLAEVIRANLPTPAVLPAAA